MYFFLNIQNRKVLFFHKPMDVVRVRSINCPTNMMAVAVCGDTLILLTQFCSKENRFICTYQTSPIQEFPPDQYRFSQHQPHVFSVYLKDVIELT